MEELLAKGEFLRNVALDFLSSTKNGNNSVGAPALDFSIGMSTSLILFFASIWGNMKFFFLNPFLRMISIHHYLHHYNCRYPKKG